MEITIYKPSGEITRWVNCNPEFLGIQAVDDESYIVGKVSNETHYIDIVGHTAVAKTIKPSPNHIFNYATKQWEDPRTLADIKAAQWTLIKAARTQAEYAGFIWDGSTFDSDAISQNRITGAVTLAQLSSTFTIDWTLATNQVRTLNQSEMLQVGAALGVHVQTQFAKGQSLRVQIDAATTQAEVEAIVW